MKNLFKNLYKALFNEDLIITKYAVPEAMPKTSGEKLYELAMTYYNVDPTPNDTQPDGFACVESLTTILKKMLPDFPIMTYTPTFLGTIQVDRRFKPSTEFKTGNIIISPTGYGNGRVVGHTGIIGKGGKILSNSSSSGLWSDKFDHVSWVERYSKQGALPLYIFELI